MFALFLFEETCLWKAQIKGSPIGVEFVVVELRAKYIQNLYYEIIQKQKENYMMSWNTKKIYKNVNEIQVLLSSTNPLPDIEFVGGCIKLIPMIDYCVCETSSLVNIFIANKATTDRQESPPKFKSF